MQGIPSRKQIRELALPVGIGWNKAHPQAE
jgi:hypothetical protein